MEYQVKHLMTSDEKLAQWGYGEWVEEPDEVSFKAHDFLCRIERNPLGAFCGYVILSAGHPWYELHYDLIEAEVNGAINETS